jgi:streptogramin lyase
VAYEPFAQREIDRLEELRLEVLEERIEAQLAGGKHAEVVAELEDLVREHALRERLRRQLMFALYRCGRQAEALGVYREGVEFLRDQLGLEPGVELRQLEQAILCQDDELSAPRRPSVVGKAAIFGRRRSTLVATAGALLAIASVSVALSLRSNGPTPGAASHVTRPQSPLLTGSGGLHEVAEVALGSVPTGIAVGYGSVWVRLRSVVYRVDIATNRVVARIPVPGARELYHTEVATGEGSVWTSNIGAGSVSRIDPTTSKIVATIPVWQTNRCTDDAPEAECSSPIGIAFTPGAVWVALHHLWKVAQIDPATNEVVATVPIGSGAPQAGPLALVSDDDQVYVGGNAWYGGDRYLRRLDARTNELATVVRAPIGCGWMAAQRRHVWLAVDGCGPYARGSVIDIDVESRTVDGRVRLGAVPFGVFTGLGSVWVVTGDNELMRIDPATHEITGRLSYPPGMALVAIGDGAMWLACQNGTVYRIEQ